MSKKKKLKKTLVEQILDKGQVNHEGLALNALEEELMPEDIQRRDIYKTLALIGDKTGPIVGILPLTEHLSEKKISKGIWKQESPHDSPERFAEDHWIHPWRQ